ncbi:uncharacterized protein BDFB_011117 [Asbolus verrucosus]|uniref:O-acyltransferase WSD1 C-terminal domain-containing protein n=1 Tax=Asbolus verrucosus TaxID=1661398 RepID=A0A482VJC9_ASBVE|nr:uncharacterized protein BDFB_011117 [Asbolus verrucosus]
MLNEDHQVLTISQKLWLFGISVFHPQVEFLRTTTVRTLLDTHRNQGIISVLLSVKGQANPEAVRRHLQEVVRRRDKCGNLAFPRLRHCLVARCGTYAWERGKFDLDQNLTVAPLSYKGRSVTEYNIQDYVCEIVSKYLPQGIPPWQMIIIPSSEDQHYILLKLHHVLLNEGLNIGDLLPLIPPTRQLPGVFVPKSPLVEVVQKPTAIPKLKQHLSEEIANFWNEFISNYDPLECTELLKNTPGFFQFQAIVLIALVSTVKECQKGFRMINTDLFSRTKFIILTLKRECKKRRAIPTTFLRSILVTLDPRNVFRLMLVNIASVITLPLRFHFAIYREVAAVYSCVVYSYCQYNNTLVGTLYNYVPLIYTSLKEIFYYFTIIFKAPRTIMEDILLQKETFQTITLCGRKSVAWSDPVKTDLIKTIAKTTGVSEIEIMLAAISACISRYFIQTKHLIPDFLPVTLRNINSNYIFGTGVHLKPEDSVSGILCLNLPVPDPEKEASILENLVDIKNNLRNSLEKQGLSHLLSLCQTKFGFLTKILPLSVLGVYLRYLSRKYAISITELSSRYPNVSQRTLWGQEVSSAIYWRPPQANSSVSLCLNEYADHVKLGVMCDSQLVPHHPLFARGFPEYVQELAKSAGVPLNQ